MSSTPSVHTLITELIEAATKVNLIEEPDHIYCRNQLLNLLDLEAYVQSEPSSTDKTIPDLLEALLAYARSEGLIEDLLSEKERLSAQLMNVFVPRPSTVQRIFFERYQTSPKEATDYFYDLSIHSHYIQMDRIEKNIEFQASTEYGDMEITINLSKPEKDPEQIKREREMKQTNTAYPKCLLCRENEGYAGRVDHPARSNHRVIPIALDHEKWYLQFSPYVYYNEHSIVFAEAHRDMRIDRHTFTNLLEFVSQFPHYFIGSNADLPIVGGSILTHDHYQGGHHEFAMMRASEVAQFDLANHPNVQASILKWPMSVIRLKSTDKSELTNTAEALLNFWRGYSDPEADVLAFSGETPHNTITPIARKHGKTYILDLVLRNNRTTEEHPLGLFHPHQDVHHIKKENIGLIEVMGLAVLPARLEKELQEVERFLVDLPNQIADYHRPWAEDLKKVYKSTLSEETVSDSLKKALGIRFTRILEDAGVFKQSAAGRNAFQRLIHQFNQS